jgi:hypothetical protein
MDTLKQLVKEFADCITAQKEAIRRCDPVAGNEFAKRCASAFNELRAYGHRGRNALAVLLADEQADVRVAAAAFLLRHCGDRARAVLEAEARGTGLTAFEAAQALQRWDEGTWALDPE